LPYTANSILNLNPVRFGTLRPLYPNLTGQNGLKRPRAVVAPTVVGYRDGAGAFEAVR
jgi:hypothetical protein